MAAPTFEAVATDFEDTAASSYAADMPASIASGELLVAVVGARASSPSTINTPTGWTEVRTSVEANVRASLFTRVADGSEGATQTFSVASGNHRWCSAIMRISGHDGVDVSAVATQASGGSTSQTTPSVTTTVADTLLIRALVQDGNAGDPFTPPASHTERWDFGSGNSFGTSSSGATITQASAGSSGTADITSSSNLETVLFTLAIKPAAGGSTFAATVAVTTGAATASVSATHTAPTFTGSSAPTIGGATCSASATHTTPTYTASADLTSGAATLQASAAFSAVIRTATADLGTGAATLASSATFSIPDRTATAALETGAATLTASATHVGPSYTATADLTTGAAELSSTATFFDPTSGPAPPSVASSSSNSSGTATVSLTITAPSGIVQGEVGLAIFCWASGGPGTVTPPAGWGLVYTSDHALSNMHIRAYRKVFGASEPSSYQWSWTTSVAVVGGILRLTGADPDTTIDQAADNDAGLNSGPVVCPSITTPWRQLIVRVVNLRGQHTDASPESGPTSRWNVFHSGSGGLRGAVFTQEQAASGATGTFAVTYTDTGTDQWTGATLAITSPVRSGTASLVAPPAELEASATHVAPMFSGSAALTTGAVTVASLSVLTRFVGLRIAAGITTTLSRSVTMNKREELESVVTTRLSRRVTVP